MRRTSILLLISSLLVAGLAAIRPASAGPSLVGRWLDPFWEGAGAQTTLPDTPEESRDAPPTAVSAVMLPNGKILYWDGLAGLSKCAAPLALDAGRCAKNAQTRVLDLNGLFGVQVGPYKVSWSTPDNQTGGKGDLFCADQRLLADGRVIAAGGTIWKNDVEQWPITDPNGPGGPVELYGNDATRAFTGSEWDDANIPDMKHGRWYPTLVTLASGKLFVAGGTPRLIYNAPVMPSGTGTNVVETETFDPNANSGLGTWSDNGPSANATLPLFARMHLMPDGKVLYDGSGQMWSPFGQGYDEAAWNFHATYDPVTNSWSKQDPTGVGQGMFGARSGAFSVLLPLKATEGYQARILLAGGTIGVSPSSYVATPITEIVSYNKDTGKTSSTLGPPLKNPRWYSSGVLLPDGSVLALSGADKDEVIAPGTEQPVKQAEFLNVNGTSWTPLSFGNRDRTYHNSAILLPDGRVLVGGHSPINYLYGDSGNNAGKDGGYGANNFKDYSFEIYEPRYLFDANGDAAARPAIAALSGGADVPAGILANGGSFTINTAPGTDGDDIDSVALVRLPSTTHTTDADMRMIELAITPSGDSSVTVTAPPDANVAPPGFYYLFILRDGVPSKAAIVSVGASLAAPAPAPFGL